MMLLLGFLALLLLAHASAYPSLEEMVTAATQVVDMATLEELATRLQRFAIAADTATDDESVEYGAYGEFPLRSMAEVLQHPLVRAVAEKASDYGEGANFVDFGSGCGRLALAVAAMHDWGSVVGVEAMESLHRVAETATRVAEQRGALREGLVHSLHSGDAPPHDEPVASVMNRADVTFVYSTAFPSEDGLRLPRLSASLAAVLREGSLVVTADKWLVGGRFHFEELLTVLGENDEPIHAHIWRVVGGPPAGGFEAALAEVEQRWSGEDACADNEQACQALLQALGEQPDDVPEDEPLW